MMLLDGGAQKVASNSLSITLGDDGSDVPVHHFMEDTLDAYTLICLWAEDHFTRSIGRQPNGGETCLHQWLFDLLAVLLRHVES